MREVRVTTAWELQRSVASIPDSDWQPLADLPIPSGRVGLTTLMMICDESFRVDVRLAPGTYRTAYTIRNVPDGPRTSRFRVWDGADCAIDRHLGSIGCDNWRFGAFDLASVEPAADVFASDDTAIDRYRERVYAFEPPGVFRLSEGRAAVDIPIVFPGFGSGLYPVFRLCRGRRVVGAEVVFIGREVLDILEGRRTESWVERMRKRFWGR